MRTVPTAARRNNAGAWVLAKTALVAMVVMVPLSGPPGVTAAPGAAGKTGPAPSEGTRRLVLFYTAEVHGAVEPCGCTSDPLGDISRLAAVMADARRGGTAVALLDAGSLLYPE